MLWEMIYMDEEKDALKEEVDEKATSGDLQGEEVEVGTEKKPKKAFLKYAMVAFGVLIGIGIIGSLLPCDHDWIDATCEEQKTCSKCGETEGKALGHKWLEATCEEASTCERCGDIKGGPLGHEIDEWQVDADPTCAAEGVQHGVCNRCGKTVTEELPKVAHTEGQWTETLAPTVTSTGLVLPGEKTLSCAVCGQTIKTEKVTFELTLSQKNALAKAQDYLDYTSFSYKGLIEQLEFEGFSTEDSTFAADYCGADWNVQAEKKAADYLDYTSFSHSGLVDQLIFEGFTREQAEHGVASTGL